MNGGQENDDKFVHENFLVEELNEDDNIQFALFRLQVILANS